MSREEKMILIVRNSDFTYEELEKLPSASIDSLYVAHVLEKNGSWDIVYTSESQVYTTSAFSVIM